MLGNKFIGLRVYWRLLREHHFLDHQQDTEKGATKLNVPAFEEFNAFLIQQMATNKYTILSHGSLAILRAVVESTPTYDVTKEFHPIPLSQLNLQHMAFQKEAIDELKTLGFIDPARDSFGVDLKTSAHWYRWQSIIKAFDHSIIPVD